MYALLAVPLLKKKIRKLAKKNKSLAETLNKKIEEILRNPHHYKSLKQPMQNMRRVHIMKSFILIYSIDEKNKAVVLHKFEHHNNVYH